MMNQAEEDVAGDVTRIVRATTSMGMRLMDIIARRREEQSRRQAEGQREAAAALAERQRMQREAMQALVTPALDAQWRENASDRDVARAFVYAEAYAKDSDVARLAHAELEGLIEKRHGDVASFVSEHVSDSDLERVPAPSGEPSASQQRLLHDRQMEDAAADANRLADAALAAQTEDKRELLLAAVADDTLAEKWANMAEVKGREFADTWLDKNADAATMSTMRAWELWAEREVERGEADVDRAEAAGAESDVERSASEDKAAARDDRAEDTEEQADMERAGLGQFSHSARDIDNVGSKDREAADALMHSRPGRMESALDQVQSGTEGTHHKKARGFGRNSEREQSLGR